jgi:hypothetical protein
LILEATADGWVYLNDLLPPSHSESDYQALHRASVRLQAQGKTQAVKYVFGSAKVILGPPGAARPEGRL